MANTNTEEKSSGLSENTWPVQRKSSGAKFSENYKVML